MPREWREKVRAKIEQRDSLAAVAKLLGVDPSNVTRMLQPVEEGGYRGSAYAIRLGEIVGEPLPGAPSDDDEGARLLRKLRAMSPAAYEVKVKDLGELVAQQEQLVAKARNRRRP